MYVCSVKMPMRTQSMILALTVLAAYPAAPSESREAAGASIADVGALLAGRYDNAAQVTRGKLPKPLGWAVSALSCRAGSNAKQIRCTSN